MVIAAIAITAGVMSYLNSRDRSSGGQIAQNQPDGAQGQKPTDAPPKTDGKDQPPVGPAAKPGQGGEVAKSEEKGLRKPQRAAEKPGGVLAQARRPVTPAEPTPQQLVREAEQKYVAAIAILQRDFNQRRSQLDPEVRARFDNALADIDKTIAETRRVVRQNPDDPIALQYLLAAYSKKVDALREMSRD
jgi:hypothetical protein